MNNNKTTAIIVHGTLGNPRENWFPWIAHKLEERDYRIFIPKFPTPESQSLNNWLDVFNGYRQYLNENAIVIGHSLGPAFLLSILEKLDRPIKAAFFVSGFIGMLGDAEFDELNQTFVTRDFDWEKIKSNCSRFYVINSDNDPYVPITEGRKLADHLGAELIILKNAGHINKESGYTEFEFLLEKIIEEESKQNVIDAYETVKT